MTAARRRLGFGFWSFVLVMLALTGLFAWLGVWQVQRLAEKEALVGEVDRQLTQPPYDLPPADQWELVDLETYAYHPLTVTGRYAYDQTVLVFTNLSPAKGKFSGPGYWVMTPLSPAGGGSVFINRGFIPQSSGPSFTPDTGPSVDVTITGIGMKPEASGSFTPGPDAANRVEWVRDPARLAALSGTPAPVFGLTIDAPAGDAGALPQGGETVIEFPNNHLGYAMTWFGFALLTPGLLAYWIFRQIRPDPRG